MKKVKSKRLSQIRGRTEKTGFKETRLIVYHKLPPRVGLPPRVPSKPNALHLCPDPYKIHPRQKIYLHKAGWAWSGPKQIQRFRCPRCGWASTFAGK